MNTRSTYFPLPSAVVFLFQAATQTDLEHLWVVPRYRPGPSFVSKVIAGSPKHSVLHWGLREMGVSNKELGSPCLGSLYYSMDPFI